MKIVNPAKLAAAQRDSVCAQCHLTGAARVARKMERTRTYQPGDLLTDTIAVFTWSDAKTSPISVTSHFEKLLYSRCKEKSGDKLWCASCHDPHGEPGDPVAHYRERCLNCHATKPCRAPITARRAANNDCRSCHMPKSDVAASEHAVYTDHSIPRQPSTNEISSIDRRLVPLWLTADDPRDSALAHAIVATTEPKMRRLAFDLLRATEARDPNDLVIAAQLAQFYDRMGQPDRALPLLERVFAKEPSNLAAATNLGVIYAQRGRLDAAIRVWEDALRRNPALTGTRINVAVAQWRMGETNQAVVTVQRALSFDPDSAVGRRLLTEITTASPK